MIFFCMKINFIPFSMNLLWSCAEKVASPGRILGTALVESLRSTLTFTRQAENWLKYLSSFGYAIAFDDGRHINIHLCCLSTLQTDLRKGCSNDQFSFLTRSPWDPVPLGTMKCLVKWLSCPSGGSGGGTDQERPLDWKALKDYCFLAGSLLLEQRKKLGCNFFFFFFFLSNRTTVAIWGQEADLAA